MADGVRMMDIVATSRAVEELRRADPEQKVQAHRVATQAALRRVEDLHRDVEQSERSDGVRVRDRAEDDQRRGRPPPHPHSAPREEAPPEPGPEQDEGHLLDITV